MKLSIRFLAALVCFVLMLSAFAACSQETGSQSASGGSNDTQVKTPFKVAFVGPLTGDFAQYGISMKEGFQIAVQQWNDAGGVNGQKVEVIYYDDRNDAKEAVSVTNQAVDQGVIAVLGPFASTCALAMSPVLIKNEIIHYAISCSHPDVTKAGIWVFRGYPLISVETYKLADAATTILGYTKVAVIYTNNDWGKSVHDFFCERVAANGGTITDSQNFVEGQTKDFTPMLSKMISTGAEVIFMGCFYNDAATMILQLETLDFKGQIITSGPVVNDGFPPLIAGGHAEGIVSSATFRDDNPDPTFQAFKKMYTEKTGRSIDFSCIIGYDSAASFLYCVSQVGEPDKYKVRDALANLKDFEGCNGKWSFNENRDPVKPAVFVKIEKDNWVIWDGDKNSL